MIPRIFSAMPADFGTRAQVVSIPLKRFPSFDRFAVEQFEILRPLAALDIDAEALALVHRPAGGIDFRVGLSEQRLIAAGFDRDQTRRIEGNVARAKEEL